MAFRTPTYRLHKATGQAVVTLNDHDHYLGRYGSDTSRAEYDRLISEWLANGRRLPTASVSSGSGDLTVSELLVDFLRFVDTYYQRGGKPTGEATLIRYSVRPLRRLYGHTPAHCFGPLALKAVRQDMIDSGLCRKEVNRRVRHVVRVFAWAVENERVPPSVHHGLKAVASLRKHRSEARETEPVKPVPAAFVDAIRSHVTRQVWTMIQVQCLTGMRPGEVCQMRTCDLDVTGRIWIYTPARHKTEHHDKARTVYVGPRAQEILRPWLRANLTTVLFSPREAMQERCVVRREARRSPMTPSHRARTKKPNPRKTPSESYNTDSYRRAIAYGCKRAGVPTWHPNQLRHNAATMLRKEFGLDTARVILGHSSVETTEIYAEVDCEKAIQAIERVG